MNYRAFLFCIILTGLFFAPAARAQSAAAHPKGTIVLIHGAWGGGWAFREVDRLLTADGYKVYRPTLTGQGERSHLSSPDISLETHIQDVTNVLEWENLKDVILVGHSYGGMVITGVADRVPQRIKQLIYLDALLPENGESADAIRNLSSAAPLNTTVKDGFIVPTWLKADAPLPHDVLMPAHTFADPISLKNQEVARKLMSSYILTVDPGKQPSDDMFYPFYQRASARGFKMMTMTGDHNVQWSRPKELVRYLEQASDEKATSLPQPTPMLASEATPLGAPTQGLPTGKETFVIVHGAWGGGYAFKTVDEMLSADGHKVYRPTMTGQGEHVNLADPKINLTTHINDIVNVILWENLHDVVLVGHSYGGMVITGVADRVPDRIKRIVYVDAFLPENGQSLNTARGPATGGRGPASRPTNNGFVSLGNADPNRPPPHDVPQSAATFSEPVTLTHQDAVAKIPAVYILTVDQGQQPENDTFYPFYLRAQARGWAMHTMTADHNVHVSHPKELVEILESGK